MYAELTARVADAIAAMPDVAYLSPHPRSLLTALAHGDSRAGRGVTVRTAPGGAFVEIRVALRRYAPVLATVRAVRGVAEDVLDGFLKPGVAFVRVTVTVTAII
jgi:hypothetical protein